MFWRIYFTVWKIIHKQPDQTSQPNLLNSSLFEHPRLEQWCSEESLNNSIYRYYIIYIRKNKMVFRHHLKYLQQYRNSVPIFTAYAYKMRSSKYLDTFSYPCIFCLNYVDMSYYISTRVLKKKSLLLNQFTTN